MYIRTLALFQRFIRRIQASFDKLRKLCTMKIHHIYKNRYGLVRCLQANVPSMMALQSVTLNIPEMD
jgi:hypothetical protein